jgi:hypothetical protein
MNSYLSRHKIDTLCTYSKSVQFYVVYEIMDYELYIIINKMGFVSNKVSFTR